ncbi:MAG: hypothetical protein OEL88_05985 [Sterolibacteriaceae bacterium MAG5]|nr:hypothetical protein [Candidatus Nitricoxidireducens bremensis]
MLSPISLKPYFGGASLAALVTVLRAVDAPRSKFLYDQVITPEAFEPLVFAFCIFLGLVLIAATPWPTIIRALVGRIESWAFRGFSGLAGVMGGWGIAGCVLHVITTGSAGLFPALVVGSYAILLTVGFLWVFEAVSPIVREYTQLRFRERRGIAYMRWAGWFLVLYGSWDLWVWATHG